MHDVRVFYARCASVDAPRARLRKREGSDDWLLIIDEKKWGKVWWNGK